MNTELLAVVEYMERERGLEREMLLQALEGALVTASRKSVGPAGDLRISIDRETLDIKAFARLKVVDRVRNEHDEISFDDARRQEPGLRIGEYIEKEVTPKDFGRIAAQTAKQTIMQKLRQAEKERVFEEYKDRPGDIVTGMVRRFDRSDVVVDLGRAEAVLYSRERVPTEEYQIGDRIRALLLEVQHRTSGPQVLISRAHPDFVRRLFELEVTEITDGTVELRAIAREAGYRSKIAVLSHDEKVDPVGACVGLRGQRVKNIVRELSGEKIDIVRWSDDIRTFVTNALAPAKLMSVQPDESTGTVTVMVAADQLSLAIGKKGQNARLTAKLTNWKIDIVKDESSMGFEERVAQAIDNLANIPGLATYATQLVHAGFLTREGLMEAEISDLMDAIEGLDEEQARALQDAVRATTSESN